MKKLCTSDWLKKSAFSCNTGAKLSHACDKTKKHLS